MLLRSRGGDDVRANIVPLCERCHADYHQVRGNAMDDLAWYLRTERPDVCAYLVEKLGESGASHWFAVHWIT